MEKLDNGLKRAFHAVHLNRQLKNVSCFYFCARINFCDKHKICACKILNLAKPKRIGRLACLKRRHRRLFRIIKIIPLALLGNKLFLTFKPCAFLFVAFRRPLPRPLGIDEPKRDRSRVEQQHDESGDNSLFSELRFVHLLSPPRPAISLRFLKKTF